MRYAIISDIHGNLPAFEAVLNDLNEQGIDRTICLGDIVGYGPWPSECVQWVAQLGIPSVLGNHDLYSLKDPQKERLSELAAASVGFTRERLSSEECEWLAALPVKITEPPATFIHATLHPANQWGYVRDAVNAGDHFDHQKTRLCFIGHTHVPQAYMNNIFARPIEDNPIEIDAKHQYLFNVGAVGQPRDGDTRAAYGILDIEQNTYELRRVVYDHESASQATRDAGLPEKLAQRLLEGK